MSNSHPNKTRFGFHGLCNPFGRPKPTKWRRLVSRLNRAPGATDHVAPCRPASWSWSWVLLKKTLLVVVPAKWSGRRGLFRPAPRVRTPAHCGCIRNNNWEDMWNYIYIYTVCGWDAIASQGWTDARGAESIHGERRQWTSIVGSRTWNWFVNAQSQTKRIMSIVYIYIYTSKLLCNEIWDSWRGIKWLCYFMLVNFGLRTFRFRNNALERMLSFMF